MGKFALKLFLALALALGAGGVWLFFRDGTSQVPSFATARIGEATVRYSVAYGRSPGDREGGRLDQLNLAARFPDFSPAGGDLTARPDSIVFIRLDPADPSLPPEERMDKLYARFLEPDEWSNPGGLMMRRFEPTSPFGREELYYAPPEGRLFTARCTRPAQPPDGLPETCLHDFRVGKLDVQIRFSPELLPEWEALSESARALARRVVQ